MDIQKRCQWCGKPFIVHKMTTLYCSTACIDKAYRAKKKQKLKEQVDDEQQVKLPIIESFGHKPFISPKEAAALLGISVPTIYRYMAQGMFKALRTSAKIIIRWSDLEAWFDNAPAYVKRNNRKHKIDSDSYTMKEICEKFEVNRKVAMRRIEHFDIPKIYEGRNVSFSKTAVDRYFAQLIEDFNKDDYYTIQQIMEKYDMSYTAVISFAARHKIPRETRHREVFYSKLHFDSLKGNGEAIDPLYYTYKEVMEKYGFSKDQVSYYLHTYHIDRFKRGSLTMINRKNFDKIISERMNGNQSIANINSKIEKAQDLRAEMLQREAISTSENIEVIPYLDDSSSGEDNNNIGKPARYINAEEIADRYKQSKKWVHYLTRQKKVPRVQKAGILFYDEKVIEELFSRYASTEGITEWYTTDDIEEKYNMTAVARRSFTHRHNIPTKKEYGITYYSKLHVDFARNPGMQYAEDYYMVEQIMAKYNVDRETVYGIVRYKKIPSVKDGQYSLYLKTAVDKFFGTKNEDNT